MQRVVATAVERFGGLDVVVANAGIASRAATLRAMSAESFERVVDVNLNGVYLTVDAALPEIIRRKGHVVVISSVYAFVNGIGAIPYAISKAGVEQLGRALRVELVQHGASATVAYFGFIDTEMVHRAIDQDPLVDALSDTFPAPLRKRLKPAGRGGGDRARHRGPPRPRDRAAALERAVGPARDPQPAAGRADGARRRNPGDPRRARQARWRRAADDGVVGPLW